MKTFRHPRRPGRRGAIAVMSVFVLIVLGMLTAFAIDLGYLLRARSEVQRSADAAAMAAVWVLLEKAPDDEASGYYVARNAARSEAQTYASVNAVLNQSPHLAQSTGTGQDEDVVVGYLSDIDSRGAIDTSSGEMPNAVQIRVRRSADQNGSVRFLLASMFGHDSADIQATARAAFAADIKGFKVPGDGSNLPLLPYAIDEVTWNQLEAGIGNDQWAYDNASGTVSTGSDGILEVNLFPQGTGSPGNRGTVDIGSSNNSTSDLARQITGGISPSDLAFHGGKLELDANGELLLGADPGISAGVKDELASIIGQARAVPVFRSISGNGNNAVYTIVKFVGIRIVHVKLTGKNSSKHVLVQPATVITKGAIANTSSSPASPSSSTSKYVYSYTKLVP